jgi:hypothetical protein
MRNSNLVQLNFSDLLVYPDGKRAVTDCRRPCGFCVCCEKKGLLPHDGSVRFKLMSHAADTSDYEELLRGAKLPEPAKHITAPIMFLLESPGGQYWNGEEVVCEGVVKEPPTNIYFWAFDPEAITTWPEQADSLRRNEDRFGGYFAYLMNTFHLANVYITNVVKCGLWDTTNNKFVPNRGAGVVQRGVRDNCVKRYLSREITEFDPHVIFAFGWPAYNAYNAAANLNLVNQVRIEYLRHPSARGSFVGTIKSNDQTIREVLQDAGLL